MPSISHDILIIGAGIAGQRAAIEARQQNMDVGIVSKVHPVRAHVADASDGINAAMGPQDDWKKHFNDTVYGGDFLGDQDAIEIMCQEAPARVKELESSWGLAFSRTQKGEMARRVLGGHQKPRTHYAEDRTGHLLLHLLHDQLMKTHPTMYTDYFCVGLVVEENGCQGAILLDIQKGKLIEAHARAVMLATGGSGRIFSPTTNTNASTGDGLALAFNAGLPLEDMEFVQFHPTGMHGKGYVIPEAACGEGAHLLNAKGERFMKRYAPTALERAPRDIIARAIAKEIMSKRGVGPQNDHVLLDARPMGEKAISAHLPETIHMVKTHLNIDGTQEHIPVSPAAHLTMGGIPIDLQTRVVTDARNTILPHLYAAGETACAGVHGANGLGGNTVLESLVFGRIAGLRMSHQVRTRKSSLKPHDSIHLERARERINRFLTTSHGFKSYDVQEKLSQLMTQTCGIYRSNASLSRGMRGWEKIRTQIEQLHVDDKSPVYNTDLLAALETHHLVSISEAILASALARTESRGTHTRIDYPRRDNAKWLKHTLATKKGKGVALTYKSVVIKGYAPEGRHY
ncbi:MAG: FAD-binding protein [Candidatus Diapherotrites archaeon]|nr:FAD-binding protein [Candidatus Diapherotrites archaeon]MDZ4256712.1 FAD-binding protein [archaeon]